MTNIPRRLYERIKKVSICRKLLIKILPEGKITIPVDGRNLNIMIWNKNKFDIECEVELKFPSEIIEIYDKNEREVKEKYKKQIRVVPMNESRTALKLLSKQYNQKGCIYYIIKSTFKTMEGEINVRT